MKVLNTHIIALAALLLCVGGVSEAKTVRATELKNVLQSGWAKTIPNGTVVEFRQGDQLPVALQFEGDFLETTQASQGYVAVKRNFWILVDQNQVQVSLDGTTFKNMDEVASGSLSAGAGSDSGPADAINIAFKWMLK